MSKKAGVMDLKQLEQIFVDTAYIRTGGSKEELKCAEYLQGKCKELGMDAKLESFEVEMADIKKAVLKVNGVEIPCTGYLCAGNGNVEAPIYYLPSDDKYSISQCKGKIVLIDGLMGHWKYQDLYEAGIDQLNISLDTMRKETFADLCRVDALEKVLQGIDTSIKTGFSDIKINITIQSVIK